MELNISPIGTAGRSQAGTLLTTDRIHVIDNLRGAALAGIVLLHAVQHFGLYEFPDPSGGWLGVADRYSAHLVYLLFFGKAYAIFALLFGVSYHIQERNNLRKGIGHRRRMLVRMAWLFLFGLLLGLFYPGEILCILAIFGVLLVLVAGLPARALLAIAIVLSLQPLLFMKAIGADVIPMFPDADLRLEQLIASLRNDPFPSMVVRNAWYNRITEWMFMFSTGRVLQLGAWMMLGIVAARRGYFDEPTHWRRFNTIALATAVLFYLLLAIISRNEQGGWLDLLSRWKEAALSVIYICTTMLLAAHWKLLNSRTILSTFGRMSLTNYVAQGIVGSILFFGHGLGLFHLGATYSLLVGLGILMVQFIFSIWWSSYHDRGPLEGLWGRLASGTARPISGRADR
jgi:uncharacterized protein